MQEYRRQHTHVNMLAGWQQNKPGSLHRYLRDTWSGQRPRPASIDLVQMLWLRVQYPRVKMPNGGKHAAPIHGQSA